MYQRLDWGVGLLARTMALIGGAVLIGLVVMICLSITGRAAMSLGMGPVPGDVELLEMGVAFAIFAFLPWCQYNRGHARVDLFQSAFGTPLNRVIDLVADVMMAIAASLIAWRMWLGMLDKKSYFETTFILQVEIWYAYAAASAGAICFVVVCVFCILRSLRTLVGVPS